MKKWVLFFILLIGIVIGLMPWIDGYLFKKMYYQQVAFLAKQIQANDKRVQINVQSYDLGWMHSVANLTISINDTTRGQKLPIVFNMQSNIYHGPLVYANHTLKLAYAVIDTDIHLPILLGPIVGEKAQGFMQIQSSVGLNGKTWTHHYTVPAVNNNFVNWGGLSGDVSVDVVNNNPVKFMSHLAFEKLSLLVTMPSVPEITIEPITIDFTGTQQAPSIWSGNLDSNMSGVSLRWPDGRSFDMKHFIRHLTYDGNNGIYNINTTISIESIDLPGLFSVTHLSNITGSFLVKHLQWANDVLKILTPTSTAQMKLNVNTNLGAASLVMNASLIAIPEMKNELINNANMDLTVRVAQPLVMKVMEGVLQGYVVRPDLSPSSQVATNFPDQVKKILDGILQQGYIQQDKNDYVITFTRKGTASTLNGLTMSDADLSLIPANINKIIVSVMAPPALPVVKSTPLLPVPVVKTATYHCYWMDSSSGKNEWKLFNGADKTDCYALDSCSGGMSKSLGGCYKWAASPDANPESWDAPVVPVH